MANRTIGSGITSTTTSSDGNTYNIKSGGTLRTISGTFSGTANISSGGLQVVSAGGTLSGATENILSGGTFEVLGGATVSATTFTWSSGGVLEIGSGFTLSKGTTSWTIGNGFTGAISGGQILDVMSSGIGTGVTVSSGGHETVSAGGTGSATTVLAGGTEVVLGTETSGTVNSGTLTVSSGGATIGETIKAGSETVLANGTATSTTVSGGTETVSATGHASGTTVLSGGAETVLGTETSGTVSSGTLTVSSGGSTTGETVKAGSETVLASGSATSTTVSGGTETVSGGNASATLLTGGSETVVSGGAEVSGTVRTGTLTVSAGGSVSGEVISGGSETVSSGGQDSGTTILTGGSETVTSGGTVRAPTISGGYLDLSSGAIVSGGVAFTGGGVVEFENTSQTASTTISGLQIAHATSTTYINAVDLKNVTSSTISAGVISGSQIVLTNSGGGTVATIALNTAPTSGTHVDWITDSTHGGTDVFLSDTPCFAAGTRILTEQGERTVESLRAGDMVVALTGETSTLRPVKWIGWRRINVAAHPRPHLVAPVRVQCGAFGDNMPHTDLVLSPDHAVFVDGKLIAIRQLINGTTIRAELGCQSVTYYHVELAQHSVLLSEGLPSESYLDTGNRGFFANGGEPLLLHPDLLDESDTPDREAGSCAPFVTDEATVQPIWQRLADRAAALGLPAAEVATTSETDLHLVVKGRRVRPLFAENGLYIFALPRHASDARLVSRASLPTDARPWIDDRRELGVYVSRMVLRDASQVQEIPVDHPGLSDGWWAVERAGSALRRWTSGDAALPLPETSGPAMLELRLAGSMTYVVEQRSAA